MARKLPAPGKMPTDIMLDTGAVINALLFRQGVYPERTGFMAEVRQNGIAL